ncbi:hypothetical protein BD309DRAFT_356316 [Dichomitus squalens]|nr:hypothetical protein BD309DRAFT_356316 [Dichomitus squalens]
MQDHGDYIVKKTSAESLCEDERSEGEFADFSCPLPVLVNRRRPLLHQLHLRSVLTSSVTFRRTKFVQPRSEVGCPQRGLSLGKQEKGCRETGTSRGASTSTSYSLFRSLWQLPILPLNVDDLPNPGSETTVPTMRKVPDGHENLSLLTKLDELVFAPLAHFDAFPKRTTSTPIRRLPHFLRCSLTSPYSL